MSDTITNNQIGPAGTCASGGDDGESGGSLAASGAVVVGREGPALSDEGEISLLSMLPLIIEQGGDEEGLWIDFDMMVNLEALFCSEEQSEDMWRLMAETLWPGDCREAFIDDSVAFPDITSYRDIFRCVGDVGNGNGCFAALARLVKSTAMPPTADALVAIQTLEGLLIEPAKAASEDHKSGYYLHYPSSKLSFAEHLVGESTLVPRLVDIILRSTSQSLRIAAARLVVHPNHFTSRARKDVPLANACADLLASSTSSPPIPDTNAIESLGSSIVVEDVWNDLLYYVRLTAKLENLSEGSKEEAVAIGELLDADIMDAVFRSLVSFRAAHNQYFWGEVTAAALAATKAASQFLTTLVFKAFRNGRVNGERYGLARITASHKRFVHGVFEEVASLGNICYNLSGIYNDLTFALAYCCYDTGGRLPIHVM